MTTTYYHANGKKSHRGVAYQFEKKDGTWNYYWDGPWKFYDESGVYLGIKTYDKGKALNQAPVMTAR